MSSAAISAPAGGNLDGSEKFEVFESTGCSGTAILGMDPNAP